MRNKFFRTALIITLLLVSVGTLWAKYEPQANITTFYQGKAKELNTEGLVVLYHKRMNEFFNFKTELLIKSFDKKAIHEAPKEDKKCEKENVSTYCVAEAAVDEYFAFLEAFETKRTALELPNSEEGITAGDESDEGKEAKKLLITEVSALQSQRLEFIDEELDVAFETMDLALKAYNELHRAYPLHVKYEEIIAELKQYREMIAEVRHEVEFFPNKFIDVSTTSCN